MTTTKISMETTRPVFILSINQSWGGANGLVVSFFCRFVIYLRFPSDPTLTYAYMQLGLEFASDPPSDVCGVCNWGCGCGWGLQEGDDNDERKSPDVFASNQRLVDELGRQVHMIWGCTVPACVLSLPFLLLPLAQVPHPS